MSIINNLLLLLEEKRLKQSDLCDAIGISSSTMTNWKNRGTDPPSKHIIPICEFLNVSPYILLTGKEKSSLTSELSADEQELFKIYKGLSIENKARVRERAEVLAELEAPAVNEPEPEEDKEIETIFIEYSTLRVSAGTGEPLIDDTYPEFIEVKRSELTEEANFAVKINGNSMLPHYKNNDIVLVRSQPEVSVGEIGIFTIDGNGYIKERAKNRLISINPDYDDIYFKENQDIRCKGLVIGTLEDEDFV
ncbi:MAG TPA: S24 family peptidase [Ruminococcus sp.]|nr:S24 family peptidase [Ruminococcus sp.]